MHYIYFFGFSSESIPKYVNNNKSNLYLFPYELQTYVCYVINNIFINAYFTFLFGIDHRLSISFIEHFTLISPRRKRIASFGWKISFDEWKTFVKISLKLFSHHDQNIFFCKTLCQSLSSPRPRVASRVSAATWKIKHISKPWKFRRNNSKVDPQMR